MHYIDAVQNQLIKFEDAFPGREVYQHGRDTVGFGSREKSVDNPTTVTLEWVTGNRLLEQADWDSGASAGAASSIGDIDYTFMDAEGRQLAQLQYRVGDGARLMIEGVEIDGGANRFTSFVSETGASSEDPKPHQVRGSEVQEAYSLNRETGQAAKSVHRVHIKRLNVNEGQAYAALQLQVAGTNPKTDTVYD